MRTKSHSLESQSCLWKYPDFLREKICELSETGELRTNLRVGKKHMMAKEVVLCVWKGIEY